MEGLPKIQELEEDQFSLYIEEEDVEGSTRTALLAQRLEDPDSWDEDSLHKVEEDRLRLSRFKAVRIVPETDPELNRNSSAFQFAMDDRLSSLAKSHEPSPPLLRGPRRVLRLCTFAILLPLTLVLVPLYIRLVVYPPQHYAMAPSDQRIVDQRTSSFWCQSQSVHMNGSFNAFLVPHTPVTSSHRPRHTILKKLKLHDDVKEYWGFYLKKGSTVTLSTCTRYEGGQLMILRGSENLHRCAWIGEEDSLEEIQSNFDMPSPDDINHLRVSSGAIDSDEMEEERVGSWVVNKNKENLIVEDLFQNGNVDNETENYNLASAERKYNLRHLLHKALRLSKGKHEILNILKKHEENNSLSDKPFEKQNNSEVDEVDYGRVEGMNNKGMTDKKEMDTRALVEEVEKELKKTVSDEEVENKLKKTVSDRIIRSLNQDETEEESTNNGQEEIEEGSDNSEILTKRYSNAEIGVEQIIGGLNIPSGLTYERGFINQSHANDISNEEHKSSYSSSEEALASCEGVILALPLHPDPHCTSFGRQGSNRISYEITVDGTYYFVFSSDNEIVVNDLFFNMTLDKVIYDVSDNVMNCTSSQDCSLDLRFLSEDKTVVEVPANDHWDDSYVLDTVCEPRVPIYLCLMLLVPLLILFCAFQ